MQSYLFILIAKETGPCHWVRFGHSRRRPAEYGKQAIPHMPIPLVKFGYMTCADTSTARSLEHKLHYTFADRRRKGGEWLQFDLTNKDERALLFDGIDACARGMRVCTTLTQVDPEAIISAKIDKMHASNARRLDKRNRAE